MPVSFYPVSAILVIRRSARRFNSITTAILVASFGSVRFGSALEGSAGPDSAMAIRGTRWRPGLLDYSTTPAHGAMILFDAA